MLPNEKYQEFCINYPMEWLYSPFLLVDDGCRYYPHLF